MELIKNLGTRKNKTGVPQSWGEFYCEFCKTYVEKRLCHGKSAKSCGCVHDKLVSETKKGKPSFFKGKKHTKETRQKQSEIKKGKYTGQNNPMYGKKHTEDTIKKQSKIRIELELSKGENNPMFGVHRFGEQSPNWTGGISFETYPIEFNKELKQFILKRDNYTCQDINCKHTPNKLHIHHIDYDKQNNNLENLITLCHSCHSKTNGKNNRQYWTGFYQNIMENSIIECLL